MDLFEAYPTLATHSNAVLQGRALRLINLTGFVYDVEGFYFELNEPRNWGRLSDGSVAVGIGTPKVKPNNTYPPHKAVVQHLRRQWRFQTNLYAAGHSYILDETGKVHVLPDVAANIPYFLLLTAPRLGGGEMPDALAQAVYLLPVEKGQMIDARPSILRISRGSLEAFLKPESWELADLQKQAWATLRQNNHPLPVDARVRPVLALRGLRHLIAAEVLPNGFPL